MKCPRMIVKISSNTMTGGNPFGDMLKFTAGAVKERQDFKVKKGVPKPKVFSSAPALYKFRGR